ncbi:MAG: restriction endonuclease subunit S [Acidimicrobiaceae bacterium]|nr:restriction endonuclease subunit S [Acidimicrobiaceae bacterium]
MDPRKHPDTSFDYIDIGGIEPGSGRIEVTKRLRGRDAPSRARQLVRAGDVILSTVRTYQRKTAIVPESLDGAIASTGFCVLRPHWGVDSRFVLHQLLDNGFVEKLSEKQTGTSYPAVRDRDVRAMGIRLAPEAEQQRIVAAIEEHCSRLDVAERALAAAESRLHALYRSVAVDVFDRPDWDWTTLGEIAEVKGGITKDSKREADPDFEEFPYLRVANVQRGYLDLAEIATIRADRHKAQRLVLRPGDILFNEGGDRDKLGRGWVWEGQIEDCIHQNHVFRARLFDDRFDPYFVSLHANSWGQQWFEAHGKQTTNLASLNLTTLKSFPVPAPSLEEQRAVATRLRSALDGIQHQRLELDRTAARMRSLRRSILAAAFAGRLVHDDSQDESAELLAAVHRQA